MLGISHCSYDITNEYMNPKLTIYINDILSSDH